MIDKIRSSRLPRHLVWTSFTTGVMRKLCYPLPATTFTQQECYDIMAPLLYTAIPYIGVNRNFPREMVHAPLTMQGLAVPDLYVEQGLGHLQRFVETTMRPLDITGHLFKVSVEQMAMELGISGCPFAQPHGTWRPLATDCLVTHMWDFANRYQLRLQSAISHFPMERQGDEMLMEYLIPRKVSNPRIMKSINRCRLYLQVARLSDLITCCGTYIRREMWEGIKLSRNNVRQYEWPRQGMPNALDWQHWRDTLVTAFGLQLPVLVVARRLHRWTIEWTKWEWYQTEDELSLVQVDHVNAQAIRFEWNGRYQHTSEIHYGTLKQLFPLFQVDVQEVDGELKVNSRAQQPVH